MSSVKEFFEIVNSKEGLNGIIFTVWIVVILLTSFGWFLGIEFHGSTTPIWVGENRASPAFWVRNSDGTSLYQLYLISNHTGSISVIAEQTNAWWFNGTYYIGDTIALGDYRVTVQSINLDKPNPVELVYFQVYDLKPLLTVLLIITTIIMASRVVNLGGQKETESSKKKPLRNLARASE